MPLKNTLNSQRLHLHTIYNESNIKRRPLSGWGGVATSQHNYHRFPTIPETRRYSYGLVLCVLLWKKTKSGKHKSKMLNECFCFLLIPFYIFTLGLDDDHHCDNNDDDGDLLFLVWIYCKQFFYGFDYKVLICFMKFLFLPMNSGNMHIAYRNLLNR